jgi:hypothetical protein
MIVCAVLNVWQCWGWCRARAPVLAQVLTSMPALTSCRFVLAAIKAGAPGAAKDVAALEKKLAEPFDPYN